MNYPNFKVVNSPIVKKPLTIIFCLPGPSYSGNFLVHWSELLQWCYRNNIRVFISQQYDAVVYYVRNKCLGGDVMRGVNQKPFDGKIDYDYMLWIDSDIIFTSDHLAKLLNWNQDIVSGIYLMQGGTHFATVKDWNIDYFKKNGSFQFLTPKDLEGKKDLIDVAYTGFGFMLIKKGIFETLQYPWFRPVFQEISENVRDFSSEDVSICQLFKQNGMKIYIDPTVKVGHEKKVVL